MSPLSPFPFPPSPSAPLLPPPHSLLPPPPIASDHPTRAAQLLGIGVTDGIGGVGEGVDADAVATLGFAGTVDVVAVAEMQSDMGGFFGSAKENQVTDRQLFQCDRLHKSFLLIGIPRRPPR